MLAVNTPFRDLDQLRAHLGRIIELSEICQGASLSTQQTFEATREALDNRLLELLVALRKVRPPPESLSVLIAGCATDKIIGSKPFDEAWEIALQKLQRDSALCQRGWKEFAEILQDCRRKADGRRLSVVLDKPLFDIFRIIWRANVPFSVAHALGVLAAWWKEEAMAACIENTLTLEEKGGVCRLQIHPKVLLNVRTLWHAFFVLKKTLSRLETAQFILPKSIDAFSLAELQQWLENFLNKLVVPYSIRDMYEKFL